MERLENSDTFEASPVSPVGDPVQEALDLIAANNLKEAHSKLSTALRSSSDEPTRLSIESALANLDQEIASRTALLTGHGDELFEKHQYQQAYEKYQEATLYAVEPREVASLETQMEMALKAARVKALNNEAIELCNSGDFAGGLDKFEEALGIVETEFLFNLIEENVEIVNRLMFKQYWKDANGKPRVEEVMAVLLKFTMGVKPGGKFW